MSGITSKQSLQALPLGTLKGKRVLMRVDYNVPLDKKSGAISNPQRVVESLPTLLRLLDVEQVQSVVLMSHLGELDFVGVVLSWWTGVALVFVAAWLRAMGRMARWVVSLCFD